MREHLTSLLLLCELSRMPGMETTSGSQRLIKHIQRISSRLDLPNELLIQVVTGTRSSYTQEAFYGQPKDGYDFRRIQLQNTCQYHGEHVA